MAPPRKAQPKPAPKSDPLAEQLAKLNERVQELEESVQRLKFAVAAALGIEVK